MTRIDKQKINMEERETIDDIPTLIETIRSEPIYNIPTQIEMIRSEPISTSDCEKHEPKVKSDRIRHHLIRQILHRQTQKIKERNVKIRKSVASIEKMTRQTRPRVRTLMTLIHLRTVIIDVDDARTRNTGKRIRSDYAQL